jgi:glycosyltransferase involved in cell wall biosynthesis
MKILLIHNFYQQAGGEDVVFRAEKELLLQKGNEIIEYTDHNERIKNSHPLTVLRDTLWSPGSYWKIKELLAHFQPEVVHCHNIFPLISPSVYDACAASGIPVVQTLHNYRLLCPNALLFRQGKVCEDCLGKVFAYPGVVHGCYRESRAQSAVVALMLSAHRLVKTWQKKVSLYIALTEFSREKFISGGLPAEKITVKPNFLADNIEYLPHTGNPKKGALFVGRLSEEKGLRTLLQAFRQLPEVPLTIAGDGPLRQMVEAEVLRGANIRYTGRLNKEEIMALMRQSAFLIFPSQWYEGFPMTIVESFANGLPVIASRLGSMAEIISDGKTGLLFTPGDAADMVRKVKWAYEHPEEMAQMGRNARREYEQKYTAERNYQMLVKIYEQAIELKKAEIGY